MSPAFRFTFVAACATTLSGPQVAAQLYADGSGALPPEPVIVTAGAGGRAVLTNTSDAEFVDVDGDGDLDVVVADGTPDIAGRPNRLLLNDGRGGFTDVSADRLPPSANTPFGVGPANSVRVDAGDVDGDGDSDLVIANLGDNRLLLNDGTGAFADASDRLPAPPRGPLAGPLAVFNNISVGVQFFDANRDGLLDLYFTNELPPIPGVGPGGSPNLLYLQRADGTFADVSATNLPALSDATINFAISDVDLDGDLDILEANIGQNRLLLNDGTGGFSDATAARLPVDSATTRAIGLGDVDGDGDVDFVTANSAAQQNEVFLNDGAGVFSRAPGRLPSVDDTSSDVALLDVDLDGDLDVAVANASLFFAAPGAPPAPVPAPNPVYLNDGTGVFTRPAAPVLPPAAAASFELEVGDLTGDGLDDVFVSNGNGAAEQLLVRRALPRPRLTTEVRPVVDCVRPLGDGAFVARFGYRNLGGMAFGIPRGNANVVYGVGVDAAPPTVFLPGGTSAFPTEAFEVEVRGFAATWVLNGRVAVATAAAMTCEDPDRSAATGPRVAASGAVSPGATVAKPMAVWPNPTTGHVSVPPAARARTFTLVDGLGRTARGYSLAAGAGDLELGVAAGTYVLYAEGGYGERVVVEGDRLRD